MWASTKNVAIIKFITKTLVETISIFPFVRELETHVLINLLSSEKIPMYIYGSFR